jgi:hypothetical protein
MASMPPASIHTRRWFQFSLGMLFVLVTVFAVWLRWELKYIGDRKATVADLRSRRAFVSNDSLELVAAGQPPVTIPFWRRWLGDKPVSEIGAPYPYGFTEAEWARLRVMFPEAREFWVKGNPD